jgi:hypothetical protein
MAKRKMRKKIGQDEYEEKEDFGYLELEQQILPKEDAPSASSYARGSQEGIYESMTRQRSIWK